MVGKEDDADLVVVLNGGESQRRSNLRGAFTLQLPDSAEVERSADIHQQHHRKFTLFLEDLDVGMMETPGDIPVDVAHIIAILILAHFREGHAASLEGRMILPGKDVLAQAQCLDFYLTDFL